MPNTALAHEPQSDEITILLVDPVAKTITALGTNPTFDALNLLIGGPGEIITQLSNSDHVFARADGHMADPKDATDFGTGVSIPGPAIIIGADIKTSPTSPTTTTQAIPTSIRFVTAVQAQDLV